MKHKLRVAAFLGALFLGSVSIRLPLLNKPFCRPREWLTANVLRTVQIWEETGIAQAHFAPIMTYPGPANKNINNTASEHVDAHGNFYYTSYPPLAFYAAYALFELLHTRPEVPVMQIFNLCLHFITGIFVYLSLRVLMGRDDQAWVPGVIGFAVYIFSPQTLWLQANVYMSDIFVQVFFAAWIYAVLKLVQHGSFRGPHYLALSALMFCFAYTEWLGVLAGLCAAAFAWRNRDQKWAGKFAAASIAGPLSAMFLTVWQYSQVSGFHDFLVSSGTKYLLRSGIGSQPQMDFHPWSLLGWMLLVTYLFLGYGANFVLLASWSAYRSRIRPPAVPNQVKATLLYTAVLPPVLHHLIFFNFTAEHEFSTLKDAPIISILAGLLGWGLWRSATGPLARRGRAFVISSLAIFAVPAAWQYRVVVGPYEPGHKQIGDYIRKEAQADEIVFLESEEPGRRTKGPFPQMIFYAHRNIARWEGEARARELSQRNGVSKAVIFTLDRDETRVIGQTRVHFD